MEESWMHVSKGATMHVGGGNAAVATGLKKRASVDIFAGPFATARSWTLEAH